MRERPCREERCQQIGLPDLLPLGPWLSTGGRCRHCGARLPTGIPVVETFMLALIALSAMLAQTALEVAAVLVLGWVLIPLVVADIRHQVLPDVLTITLFLSGLLATILLPSTSFSAAILGAALGSGSFLALRLIYLRFRGVEALGLGDVKLVAGLGAWFGPTWLPFLVLLAAGGGLLSTLVHSWIKKRTISTMLKVPFGAYLGVSALLIWVVKDNLSTWSVW